MDAPPTPGETISEDREVVALGEGLVRLSTGHRSLQDASGLALDVGGSELNVLTALAQMGWRSRWITAVGGDGLSQRIIGHARRFGVTVNATTIGASRTPLYFAEAGAPPRPTSITYDRTGSAMSSLMGGEFDWKQLLSRAAHFHCSGITLALGAGAQRAALVAYTQAKRAAVPTSFDLNHRFRMWNWDDAVDHYRAVLNQTDTLFASPHDLQALTGSTLEGFDLMRQARDAFDLRTLVMRTSTPEAHNTATAIVTHVLEEDQLATSGSYVAVPVDALGGGDAATAAFLGTRLSGESLQTAAERASWACAEKLSMPGDTWITTPFEGMPITRPKAVLR